MLMPIFVSYKLRKDP